MAKQKREIAMSGHVDKGITMKDWGEKGGYNE